MWELPSCSFPSSFQVPGVTEITGLGFGVSGEFKPPADQTEMSVSGNAKNKASELYGQPQIADAHQQN